MSHTLSILPAHDAALLVTLHLRKFSNVLCSAPCMIAQHT